MKRTLISKPNSGYIYLSLSAIVLLAVNPSDAKLLEAFDADWKGNPNDSHGAEKHWGLYTIDRKTKRPCSGEAGAAL